MTYRLNGAFGPGFRNARFWYPFDYAGRAPEDVPAFRLPVLTEVARVDDLRRHLLAIDPGFMDRLERLDEGVPFVGGLPSVYDVPVVLGADFGVKSSVTQIVRRFNVGSVVVMVGDTPIRSLAGISVGYMAELVEGPEGTITQRPVRDLSGLITFTLTPVGDPKRAFDRLSKAVMKAATPRGNRRPKPYGHPRAWCDPLTRPTTVESPFPRRVVPSCARGPAAASEGPSPRRPPNHVRRMRMGQGRDLKKRQRSARLVRAWNARRAERALA